MVAAVRSGRSQRAVARQFYVALRTVQNWLRRAGSETLEAVDWSSHRRTPRLRPKQTDPALERRVCLLRKELERESALGFVGAQAIHDALCAEQPRASLPSVRTLNRILRRNGLLDGKARVRRPAPSRGWYLPSVTIAQEELDSFDVIEDLRMEGRGLFQVFTARALWGSAVGAWPAFVASTDFVLTALELFWRKHGLPAFAQFDNDVRFQGGHNHPDVIGRVMRLCLSLDVTPVFAPPLETGFQAAIENFNGLWQRKVWERFHHETLETLSVVSQRFTQAYSTRLDRVLHPEHHPRRRPFPPHWSVDLQRRPRGRIIYLRRTDQAGAVKLLGHRFSLDPLWPHRLARCEVDLDRQQIDCFRLRRRAPEDQPLIASFPYQLPQRRFDIRPRHKHPVTTIS
jgi:hypothetical protein